MPSYVLDIAIKANDQASSTVKSVDSEFGNLAKTVGTTLVAGLAVGGAALVGFGIKALQMGSDAAETKSKFNAVFKDMAGEVGKWSDKVALSMGLTKAQSKGMLASIQDLLVPLGLTRTTAADLSKQTLQLAGDLASFDNLNTADVVNDINSALVGETEPMKKYGVVLNEAAIKAKALSMNLADVTIDEIAVSKAQIAAETAAQKVAEATNKYGMESREARKANTDYTEAINKLTEAQRGSVGELNAAQKAQAALALIMDSTKDAQGDLAKTQDGFANQWRQTQAAFAETVTTIGEQLLPLFTPLLQNFNDWITIHLPKFTEQTAAFFKGITDGIAAVHTAWDTDWAGIKTTTEQSLARLNLTQETFWFEWNRIFTDGSDQHKTDWETFLRNELAGITQLTTFYEDIILSFMKAIANAKEGIQHFFTDVHSWVNSFVETWNALVGAIGGTPLPTMHAPVAQLPTYNPPRDFMTPNAAPPWNQQPQLPVPAPAPLPGWGTGLTGTTINIYGGDVNAVTNAITDTLRSNGVRP